VIGRHARLELAFACRGGRTVLTHAYAEPPLRIGRTFDIDGAAYLILVCSAPGIFAGDSLHQYVTVGRGARVLLASQSALQVHPTAAIAPAAVHYDYRVEDDGELHCQWDPVIPFAGASLVQRVSLQVAGRSRFYWSDALMSGRASRGESWRFASVDHELRLEVEGSLRYLERYAVRPATRQPSSSWRWGDAHYAGTTIVYHEEATLALAERLHRELIGIAGVSTGVDLADRRLLVARFLAAGGAPFARARSTFRDGALDAVFGTPALVVRR
jgi:urease accessory protein